MKRTSSPRKTKQPTEVKIGNIVMRIYRSVTRGQELFTVISE